MAAASPYGKGIVGLLKRGWNEIPEVMGSTAMALVGIAMGSYGVWSYYRQDGDNRRYRMEYTVVRPDDPIVPKLHRD